MRRPMSFLAVILAVSMFPQIALVAPLYLTIRSFAALNSYRGLILIYVSFGLPLIVWVMYGYFRALPRSLDEAAKIDGAGPLRFFWKILLPLSRPVLATVSVLAVVGSWNAFLLPLVVLTDSGQWTLPLGVTNYSQQYTTDTARVLAFTTLSMVPALVFYAFAERQLIRGLTSGAVKG
jgi:raffinose/stachyose/melibiose transport system permease protein